MSYDIKKFAPYAAEFGRSLKNMGDGAADMEETAGRIVRHIYNSFRNPADSSNSFALIRLFKTIPYRELGRELQDFAKNLLTDESISDNMKCMTLISTAGDRPEWNFRICSQGHKAIPLVSERFIFTFPMISNLILQLGLEINHVVKSSPDITMALVKKKCSVFYVPEALGSPLIPTQKEFVEKFNIKSVVGFGGIMTSGDLYTVIGFSKEDIPVDTVDAFQSIAIDIKSILAPFEGKVFSES